MGGPREGGGRGGDGEGGGGGGAGGGGEGVAMLASVSLRRWTGGARVVDNCVLGLTPI